VTVRILIAADDPTYSRWLQHRIESLGDTFAAVVTRPAALQRTDKRITRLDCELLVAVLDFNSTEGQDSPGITWLRSMAHRQIVACDAPDAQDQVLARVLALWGPA
jgi:CheY-like chemotaxis protein